MARAGVRSVFIGIETLRPERLKEIKKGFGPEAAPEAVRRVRESGMDALGSYIIGYPDETIHQIRDTVRQARRIPSSTAQFTILTPYPGTALFEQVRDRITSWNWAHYDGYHSVFHLNRLSRFAVQMMLLYSHAGFYLRSLEAIRGFARFAWLRRRNLPFVRRVMKDMFFTPDVEAAPMGRETSPAPAGIRPPREAAAKGPTEPGRVT
jgi:radical SAM superfamily enzyme YgiQ (UPF0313 family)